MVHRGIATLAGGMVFCFMVLAQLDSQFFFLHFYESLMYLAIILMLFYFEDHWAYMLGMLTPAGWLILNLANWQLVLAFRQTAQYFGGEAPLAGAGPVTLLTAFVSLLMMWFCWRRWKQEFSGLGKGAKTFWVSLVIVLAYYGILVFWFTRLVPVE
jgi:hypothetical protein